MRVVEEVGCITAYPKFNCVDFNWFRMLERTTGCMHNRSIWDSIQQFLNYILNTNTRVQILKRNSSYSYKPCTERQLQSPLKSQYAITVWKHWTKTGRWEKTNPVLSVYMIHISATKAQCFSWLGPTDFTTEANEDRIIIMQWSRKTRSGRLLYTRRLAPRSNCFVYSSAAAKMHIYICTVAMKYL